MNRERTEFLPLLYSLDTIAIFSYTTVTNGLIIGGGGEYISIILFYIIFKCSVFTVIWQIIQILF